ncbi:MAG: regulatory protein RecX [Clostridia bacterium]|nr:regulatory protein RecX [Clostridia bacterium]
MFSRRRTSPPKLSASQALDNILSRADYPADRLVTKLTDRGYPKDEAERAVADAVAGGWVDDRRLIGRIVPALIRQGKGPRAIRAALAAKGFDARDIDAVDFGEILDTAEYDGRDADMVSACAEVIRKKCAVENGRLTRESCAMLARRGYTGEIMRLALEKLLSEDGDPEG